MQDLQSRNERMFLVTVLVENIAAKRQKLFNDIFAASGVAQKYNCALKRLDYQQEQGLMSSLALGTNQIEIERGLTTSSTAIFVPFTTCELFQEGEALYYGLNALSNNLIMANRKTLKNPNGLFLGTPGSGKSFSAKREIVNVFLLTEDDIIIADPENEYGPLVQQFGSQGQVIDISPTSTNYINPMDINLDYSDDENPITLKSDFILSLCDLIIGGKEGLSPIERTIIDRCTRLVYREYLQNPCPENMPILGDLYELLLKQSEPEAQNIATALEIYVNGSLNVFNHRSNIQMDQHRVLCFQLKSLGKALKEIGLLIMQDAVWNRVTANRSKHKTTWFYIDEFHLLLKGQTGSFSVEIWKRFRKWGGIPSGLTQNVKDLLASREIENIFENSDFISERTSQKLEAAQQNLPTRRKLRLGVESDVETGKAKRRLKFEKEVVSQRDHMKGAKPLRPVKKGANAAIGYAHKKIYENEHENIGIEAAHRSELVAEGGLRALNHRRKSAPYRKVSRLQKKASRASAKAAYQQVLHENPKLKSNLLTRMWQKQKSKGSMPKPQEKPDVQDRPQRKQQSQQKR